jgi:calmodulin
MRRAGQNPTDVEVQDLINKIDDGSGTLDFSDFCLVIKEKTKELDSETHFKDTFRVFSKDEEGGDIVEDSSILVVCLFVRLYFTR